MNERQIEIRGLKINYKIAGNGPCILVLHGWGGSSDSWLKFQELMAEKGFKVVIPDLPGFGKSGAPSASWSLQNYVDFVSDFAKELNLENFYLLGHSFGGRIAIKFSALYPEKIRGLILCAPAGIGERETFARKIKLAVFSILSKTGVLVFSLPALKILQKSTRKFLYFLAQESDYYYIQADSMKETFKNVIKENLTDYFPRIKVPTLIIWGRGDRMVPVKFGYLLKDKISDSRLEIIEEARHGVHLQTPEKLANLVHNFIKAA